MQKYFLFILLSLGLVTLSAQELNCSVNVVANNISGSNKQIFKTMETSIQDFLNITKWTNKKYKDQEKIQCALTLIINEQEGSNQFKGSIQLQGIRPVYGSTYSTPTINFNDVDVNFIYEEFQPLVFNKTSYESNLVSLLSFYAYVIIGFDADSFASKGGDEYFKTAQDILLTAQQGGYKGWNSIDGNKTRFQLIDNIQNGTYSGYRTMMYNYHLKGLDYMYRDQTQAKKIIANAIISLKKIYARRPNAFLLRLFLDTKSDEIEAVFKDGPRIDTRNLKEMLLRVYPSQSEKWNKIE
jgi:hypothetical protein